MIARFLTALGLAPAIGLVGCTQESGGMQMDHHDHSAMSASAIPADAVDLHNTTCVVSGDKVGDSKEFAVYEGKVYHFCCADCPKEFKKDPAKYARAVAADPAKYGVKEELVK